MDFKYPFIDLLLCLVQKLYSDQDDKSSTLASKILKNVGKVIRYQEMEIRIGFSMIVQNSSDRHIFLYAAKAKAFFSTKLSTEEEFSDLVQHFKTLTDHELLQKAFNRTVDSETFQKSGYRNGLLPFHYELNRKIVNREDPTN